MKLVTNKKVAAVFFVAVAGMTMPAWGFKPEYESHGHTMITRAVLGGPQYSFGSVNNVPLTVPRFKFQFSTGSEDAWAKSWAINHIVKGAQSRDLGYVGDGHEYGGNWPWLGIRQDLAAVALEFEPSDGFPQSIGLRTSGDLGAEDGHFDNDNFLGSMKSIKSHFDAAFRFARDVGVLPGVASETAHRNRLAARLMLGKALHTVQDFYAHSNWVHSHPMGELAEYITQYSINESVFSSQVAATLARQEQRKDALPFPAGQGGGIAGGSPCSSRVELGEISPPFFIQTWQHNDGNYQLSAGAPVTTGAWWDTKVIEAGMNYQASASDVSSAARCDHGVSDDTDTGKSNGYSKFSGVAKDLPSWPPNPAPNGRVTGAGVDLDESYEKAGSWGWLPSTPDTAIARAAADATELHLLASYAAALHTKLALETFVSYVKLNANSPQEADAILGHIFGVSAPQPTVTWVIDRSGTMADILPGVASAVRVGLVPGARHVLVDFVGSDTLGGTPTVTVTTGNVDQIGSRLGQIEARGGGGCATPMWSAIDSAVEAALPNSTVVAITDASASDTNKEAAVVAATQAKGIKLVKLITGSCSPLDPSYTRGAQATGGSVRILTHDDDGIAAALAGLVTDQSTERTVHTEAATLGGAKTVSFPVETGATALSIVASGALSAISVTQPNGVVLAAGPGVTVSQILNGYVYSVASPMQGNWQVAFTGSGDYALSAYVNAPINFATGEHASIINVGRPGHEYRPRLAATGQTGRVWFKATIEGGQAPVTLDLLRLDGTVINSFPLSKMTDNFFEGEIVLPSEAHRLRVRGAAADNTAFARILGQGNVAPTVAQPGRVIASQSTSPTWRAGTVNAFAINLKNLGGNDAVSFAPGVLPTGAAVTCNPTSIAVPGSEQVNVLCSIFLPEAPDRGDFSVVVSSTTAVPAVAQTVTIPLTPLKLPLSCALDIDGDNRVDPAVDGVLLTRYLLGFRGAALTNGLTIPGPRKTDALLSAFFGNAAQFDLVGRASPAPTATVDGLLMTRLMLGYDDSSLLNGISIPSGAQFTTATAIKDNVVAKCAGGF